MREAYVGVSGFYYGAQLRHRLSLRLRRVREGRGGVVVDGEHFAAELIEPARREKRARTVAAINGNRQTPRAYRLDIKGARQNFQVMSYGISLFDSASDALPSGFGELGLVEDVEQFVGLRRVEVESVCANELERVPRLRVVPCGYRDAAVGARPLDCELQARRRADAEVNDFAAGGEQPREHGGARHRPRRARVAADEYAPGIQVSAEGLREADDQLRRESFADRSAHATDADFKRVHSTRPEHNRNERGRSLKTFDGLCAANFD